MKLFLLGAGYVGRAFLHFAKQHGDIVTTCSRCPEKLQELSAIADKAILWEGIVPSESFDALLFFVGKAPDASYASTYLDNSRRLRHPRILYTSSTSVYGDHQGLEVDESSPLHIVSDEQRILVETENTLLHNSENALLFRLGEIIGPGREPQSKIARWKGTPIPSSGDNITNLIHLNDIVRALYFGLTKPLSGIYNLVSDLHIPRREWYHAIDPTLTWDPSKKGVHSGNKNVSNRKIKEAGFTFHEPLYRLLEQKN